MGMKKLIFACALLALSARLAFSSSALILYDGRPAMSEAFKSARFIQQLLGHFELEPTRLIRAADYRPGKPPRRISFLRFLRKTAGR